VNALGLTGLQVGLAGFLAVALLAAGLMLAAPRLRRVRSTT
jgi:uncharacterized iron-regulated membrane protein